MQKFIDYLSGLAKLSPQVKSAIESKLIWQEFPKKHVLIKELSLCNRLYFIEEGLARVFYLKDGKEITDWFCSEGMLVGPVVRNFPQKEGPHAVELIESSKVSSIHFDDLQELFDTHHEVERMGRILAIQAVLFIQNRLDSLQFESAQQRYENLLKTYPSIIEKAPLGYIASYLGITQVTLSRIRGSLNRPARNSQDKIC